MSDTCPSARIPTGIPTDRKVRRDFRTFLVRISINCRWNYRRNLMPSTTINVRRKNCNINPPLSPILFIFFSRLCFSSSSFLFSSPFLFGKLKRFYCFGGCDFTKVCILFSLSLYFFYFNYDYFFWCSLFCVLFVDKILNSTHY